MGDTGVGEGGGAPGAHSPRMGGGVGSGGPGHSPRSPSASPHAHTPMPEIFGTPPPVFRWPYDPSARLNPRDADSPQPHEEAVLDLPTYVVLC